MNKEQIEYNKLLGEYRKNAAVKMCIWGGEEKNGCEGKIVAAHSIQRGKILSSIAKNGEIFYLGVVPTSDLSQMESVFKPEGIKRFSTFSGFCGKHDKAIFQPIEDCVFHGSDEQKKIYAYRAAARELHANIEMMNFNENILGESLLEEYLPAHIAMSIPGIIDGSVDLPDYLKDEFLRCAMNDMIRRRHAHAKLNVYELSKICDAIKGNLLNNAHLDMTHEYYFLDKEYPVACCASFIPYFDHLGNRIISQDSIDNLSMAAVESVEKSMNVFLNVFPENGKTHILFSFFRNNEDFSKSVKLLFQEEEEKIKLGASNIIINYAENVAFGPDYISSLFSSHEIDRISSAFFENIPNTGKFCIVNVNLFRE